MMAAGAIMFLMAGQADARPREEENTAAESSCGSRKAAGLLTHRLSSRQRRTWESIQRIVVAMDKEGRPVHPVIYGLLRRIEESGCAIQLEIIEKVRSKENLAGQFLIGDPLPGSSGFSGVIQLNLAVIDRATVNRAGNAAGHSRFEGLGRMARYTEVLGHELSHVVLALEDQSYHHRLRELDGAIRLFQSSRRLIGKDFGARSDEHPLLSGIDSLGIQMETPANEFEARVWHELRYSPLSGLKR